MTSVDIRDGTALVTIERRLTQDDVDRYAEATGDRNPIHVDPAFAAATPFGGTIVHGMLVLALISESLTATFGRRWGDRSRLKVRFRAPARPGDTLIATGSITRVRAADGARVAECAIECRNGDGELLIGGDARVTLSQEDPQ